MMALLPLSLFRVRHMSHKHLTNLDKAKKGLIYTFTVEEQHIQAPENFITMAADTVAVLIILAPKDIPSERYVLLTALALSHKLGIPTGPLDQINEEVIEFGYRLYEEQLIDLRGLARKQEDAAVYSQPTASIPFSLYEEAVWSESDRDF